MSVRDPRSLAELCEDVEACVDRSGIAAILESELPSGGRPREISVRLFLIGMMLAVRAGLPPHIEKARWALSELPRSKKVTLGVIRENGSEVTYKMLADMFERLAHVVDTSPHFRGKDLSDDEKAYRDDLLIELTDRLLAASIPEGVPHKGSYSIDGTNVDSWARPRVKIVNTDTGSIAASHLPSKDPRRKQWKKAQKSRKEKRNRDWPDPSTVTPPGVPPASRRPRAASTNYSKPNARRKKYGVADPDSARYEKDGWKRNGKYGFGLELHSFVMVSEEGDAPIPPFTRHLRLTANRPANRKVVVDMAKRMAFMGETCSDAIYDAGYAEFVEITAGLRRAGFSPVFDMFPKFLGVKGSVAGAVVIDGDLYSPGIPEALRDIKPPAVATSMKQLDEYQQLIAERQRYALRRVYAKPKADGTMRYECPASAGRVACPLKQKSLTIASSKGVILPTNVPVAGAQGDICKQATITVDLNDPAALEPEMGYVGGLYQKHPFGSDAHYDSMKRRAYVEGAFGNIKNEAEQSLRRPSIRVMGHAKMSLVTVFVVAAANLRMGRNWLRRHHRHSGPSISPAMAAAAKAQNTALARRRRRAAEQVEVKSAGRPARLRPGGRWRDRPPRGGPPG